MAERRRRVESESEIEERLTELAITESLATISQSSGNNSNDNDAMVAELLQEDEYVEPTLVTDEEIAEQIRIEEELKATRDVSNSAVASLFSPVKSASRVKQLSRSNVSRNRQTRSNHNEAATIQAIDRDFGPDDYEMLLSLDTSTTKKPISQSDLHRLPVEVFKPHHKQTAEEKTCTICLTDYEENEQLRRLSCFHAFHQECIDQWLKEQNICPVCRLPPAQQF